MTHCVVNLVVSDTLFVWEGGGDTLGAAGATQRRRGATACGRSSGSCSACIASSLSTGSARSPAVWG